MDGYLVQDSKGNYTFTQTDFVHYDITTDGTITIGNKPYTVADSYRVNCDGQNTFHLLKVDRARPNAALVNNSYCTAQSASEIQRLIADLNLITSNFTDESALYFIASNGHPIPADWRFGTDGDAGSKPTCVNNVVIKAIYGPLNLRLARYSVRTRKIGDPPMQWSAR